MKIKVNGSEFKFFNDITISLQLDTVASAFSFTARFNPQNESHRELFKPLSYQDVEIFKDDGTLLLTGTVLNQSHKSDKDPNLVSLSGYSKGGILEDCTIPLDSYPLESLNRSLKEITEKLLKIFCLNLKISSNVLNQANAVYSKTSAEPSDSVAGYLSKLTAQRNIVLSHNEKGDIVFFRPNTSAAPKLFITKENSVNMGWSVNGQSFHSSVEVIRQPSDDNGGVSLADKAINPLVGKYRPTVSVLSSGKETDTKLAADNKMASELSNLKLSVGFEKFIEVSPGDIVEVQNDEVYLYNRTRFMASTVSISENETGYKTSLTLVLPETFTGEPPKPIFQ
ncbi:hypothetical protein [Flagellimonas nanhaiensis]|uniref:Phage tail protein n=1 Tax=Flagellimonas nanhaiensis TaxID=2292706 RepID=A0A371JL92_9FLAO|nr:hypothetical protein [Allomuricauda nanhaiensis]RDY57720.1 hypothetical protein DX873_17635 [Allomuricauda nanhaiensis]